MRLRKRRTVLVKYRSKARRKAKRPVIASDQEAEVLLAEPFLDLSSQDKAVDEQESVIDNLYLAEEGTLTQFDADSNPYQSFLNQLPSALTSMPKETFGQGEVSPIEENEGEPDDHSNKKRPIGTGLSFSLPEPHQPKPST